MGKSYRKAIIKEHPRNFKASTPYNRKVRRINNQITRDYDLEFVEDDTKSTDIVLKNPKEIYNDYDYSDYKFDYEHEYSEKDEEHRKKLKRK